jgi:hypothetical protein
MIATLRTFIEDLTPGDWIALGVGGAAFLGALAAVFVSLRSNGIAKEANDIARKGLAVAEREAEDRKREADARAVMSADLSPLQFGSHGTAGTARPVVVISNTGDRDSGRTVVRLYTQSAASGDLLTWDGEQTRPDPTRPIAAVEEERLHGPTGDPLPTHYIERTLSNVSTTMAEEFRVAVPVSYPPPGNARVRIPVRITVRAENSDEVAEWVDYIQTYYKPEA